MHTCIFCQIINKEIPSKVVFETDEVLGIIPKEQIAKGHTLLIPKQHFKDIFDIEEEILQEIAVSAKKLSQTFIETHQATGVNILHASGKDAQQSVFHFHIHIVPRYPNDKLDLWLRGKL
jgi:histidine triad (HIT) family protein